MYSSDVLQAVRNGNWQNRSARLPASAFNLLAALLAEFDRATSAAADYMAMAGGGLPKSEAALVVRHIHYC